MNLKKAEDNKINYGSLCPVFSTISIIQGKWALMILRDLMPGKKRFGELKSSIGKINPKTLSTRLKELEQAGVVKREVFAEIPPRVEYQLTAKGEELGELINAMAKWGTRWKEENASLTLTREKKEPYVQRHDKDFMFFD